MLIKRHIDGLIVYSGTDIQYFLNRFGGVFHMYKAKFCVGHTAGHMYRVFDVFMDAYPQLVGPKPEGIITWSNNIRESQSHIRESTRLSLFLEDFLASQLVMRIAFFSLKLQAFFPVLRSHGILFNTGPGVRFLADFIDRIGADVHVKTDTIMQYFDHLF